MPHSIPENSTTTLHRRENLARITSGAISAIAPVTHVAFGSGGTDAEGNPIHPSELATSLTREIARYPIEPVEFPYSTTARYTAIIPALELAGEVLNEAALVDADGELCAIKTFFDKRKEGGVTFTFQFDDEF